MTPSDQLTAFLKAWEGPPHLAPREDPCVPGVWDIGYGCVVDHDHPPLVDMKAAEDLLRIKINDAARIVDEAVTVPLAQHEFDALVSFVYNEGAGRADQPGRPGKDGFVHLRSGQPSTLLRKVLMEDFDGACLEFAKWVKAGGKVVQGLVKRRAAEADMFSDGDYSRRP